MGCLSLDALNVVIAGGGAIGSALAEDLLANFPVRQLYHLQRRTAPGPDDARYRSLLIEATEPGTLEAAARAISGETDALHLVINTVGILHGPTFQPEKRLQQLTGEPFHHAMAVNALFPLQLAQALGNLLRHGEPSIFASLSARVGSIEDNGMGGWYSYRASKAAHNMLLKTLSREWQLSHRHTAVVALHPGTVRSPLSTPFISPSYARRVLTPEECAHCLLEVLSGVTAERSGSFLDWQGEAIPW